MSDDDPSTPLPVVDRPLQRRVAWGLLAGRSKAEIASAEGISDDVLNAALTGPCMFMLINIWGVFFKEGDRGDLPLLRLLVRWALDFVLENADRVQGVGIAKAFLIKVSFKLGFNSTLKLLCDHIEGVIGVQDRQTPLRGVRGRLVDLMSWTIEVALMQLFIYQMGEEEIVRRDEYFREQILLQEFDTYSVDVYEMPTEAEPPVSEPVVTMAGRPQPTLVWPRPEEEAAASSVMGEESKLSVALASTVIESAPTTAADSAAPRDHLVPFAPWLVGSGPTMTSGEMCGSSPTMTGEDTRDLGLTLSWLASAPAIQACEAGIPGVRTASTRPRRSRVMQDVEPVLRTPIVRNLLYESVRFKRRRRSVPPVVRHLPIGRAA